MEPILQAQDLSISYGKNVVVHNLNLSIAANDTVGLIGESGSGKTTIARTFLGLVPAHSGRVLFEGTPIQKLKGAAYRHYRASVQPVFQDGHETLNPRMSVEAILVEGLRAGRSAGHQTGFDVNSLLEEVGLSPEIRRKRPHEISGGQRQRVAIARALGVGSRFLILDEPTSALDVTIQKRIIELLQRLRADHDLGFLLISHNLSVVSVLCEQALVLLHGRVRERGSTSTLLAEPQDDYTRQLRDSILAIKGVDA